MVRPDEYPEAFRAHYGAMPDDLRVIACYTTSTGGGMALVFCFKCYLLVFVDSDARRVIVTEFPGGWAEFGCMKHTLDVAEIIGATKIEE